MKQLHEYDTPLTDNEAITQEADGTILMRDWVDADYARDLERRLAACREALERITIWSTENAILQLSRNTLALTAPL